MNHPSTDVLPICHICQAKPCADHYTFTCEGCKPLSHICCTSVADGVQLIKTCTDVELLTRCEAYEHKYGRRITIATALNRRLNKLAKGGAR